MKIEEIVKSNSALPIAKKTLLNIMYTQNCISEQFNEILKNFDLSVEQFNVLRILKGQKGNPVNMFVIQERMIAKTSNTTRLVDKLLLKELCTRDVCPNNRRKIEVLITEKGIALLNEINPQIDAFESRRVKNLNANELETLNTLLEKLRKQ